MFVLFAIVISLLLIAYAFSWVYKQILKDAEVKAKAIIANAKSQTNQFAALPPEELNKELQRVWTAVVTTEIIANISDRDSHAEEELYLRAQIRFMEYFSSNVDAIDARYGKDYLLKWFSLHFDVMQAEGAIDDVIRKVNGRKKLQEE